MPLQYINELFGIPGLQHHNVLIINANEVHLEAKTEVLPPDRIRVRV